MANEINAVELDFLLRFPATPNVTSPVDFMNNNSWGGIKVSCLSVLLFCHRHHLHGLVTRHLPGEQ